MSYQLRFGLKEEKLFAIFNEPEIAKRFDEVLKENKELLSNHMSAIREFLVPLLEDEELKSQILDDNVTSKFIETTKFRIFWIAVYNVFDTMNLNVKENIINLLNSDSEIKYLLKERLVVTFSSLTDYSYERELLKFL